MDKTAIIFGARGGIGSATRNVFLNAGYSVIPVTSDQIDFTDASSYNKIQDILSSNQPSVIINCAGHFPANNAESTRTLAVNFGSNWNIIRHYIDNPPTSPLRFIMVGSSSYRSGRKDYMVYSASKAALYNLWQGAVEYFRNTNLSVDLINPVRTNTQLIKSITTDIYLEPNDVAHEIFSVAESSTVNCCVNMKYFSEN